MLSDSRQYEPETGSHVTGRVIPVTKRKMKRKSKKRQQLNNASTAFYQENSQRGFRYTSDCTATKPTQARLLTECKVCCVHVYCIRHIPQSSVDLLTLCMLTRLPYNVSDTLNIVRGNIRLTAVTIDRNCGPTNIYMFKQYQSASTSILREHV
ncbi:hypothetical protein J6590_096484 [Homalodisca vitripennis]|nr:hypothetical protein J6590_096484 [Homalodisca vitripennis]